MERREALDSRDEGQAGLHRAAAHELRERPVRAYGTTPASACRTSTRATSSWRLPRRAAATAASARSRSKPKGAAFELVDDHKFVWNILATDCDFGPDGAFYVSDWVDGWDINGKGRIYKVTDPEAMKNPAVAEAKKLLAEGLEKKSC